MLHFPFRVRYARRIPDPVLPGAERHVFLCNVEDIPENLPTESNPRTQDIDRRIYKDIAQHLLNKEGTPNTFHLKNKGITILAEKVIRKSDEDYDIIFAPDAQGIVDGAHTYQIIQKNKKDIIYEKNEGVAPFEQYVKVEILTGVDISLSTEIAGGLNTAVQVNPMSLANHADKFQWIKDELSNEGYFSKIAFMQNEKAIYDVADILRFLELFNIDHYPNEGTSHPIKGYTGKENVLSDYLNNPKPYNRMRPILKEILVLHDTISYEAPKLWNESNKYRRSANLAFVEGPVKNRIVFPFIGKTGDRRLYRGALFPMLAAFRWMVDNNPETGEVMWKGGFDVVLSIWRETAVQLMEATQETSNELWRRPDAIAKSSNHWKSLHQSIAIYEAVTLPNRKKASSAK